MAQGTPIQSINLELLSVPSKTYTDLNSISIINQGNDSINITNDNTSGYVTLLGGQTLMITSSTGFVLPTITITSSSPMSIISASVITT
jgi:hypothetical protein